MSVIDVVFVDQQETSLTFVISMRQFLGVGWCH